MSHAKHLEHSIELLLFGPDNLGHAIGRVDQLGIGALHLIADGVDHLAHEWLFLPKQATMTNAAAENFAQHVAAAFIGWQNAVVDEEGGGAGMVGNDAQAAPLSSSAVLLSCSSAKIQ